MWLHCRGHSSSRLPATASFILVPPLAPSPQAPCSPQTKSLLPLSGQAACLYGSKKLKAVIIAIISSSSTGARHPLCWRCLLGDIRAMGRLHNLPTLEGSPRPDTPQQATVPRQTTVIAQQARDVEPMLGWCRRRWASIKHALVQRLLFAGCTV